jgi:hypothetical protein
MVGSGTTPVPLFSEGFRAMAGSEMEEAIRTLVQQVAGIAQILPTLATKADLEAFATTTELRDGLADVKRHSTVLYESLRDDNRLIAEALAVYMQKTDATAAQLAALVDKLQRKGVI